MHVISGYCGLEELNNNREKHFIDLYEKTPDKFMKEYGIIGNIYKCNMSTII